MHNLLNILRYIFQHQITSWGEGGSLKVGDCSRPLHTQMCHWLSHVDTNTKIVKPIYEIKKKSAKINCNFAHKRSQTHTCICIITAATQSDLQKLKFHNERLQLTTTTRLTIIHTAAHTPDFLHSHTLPLRPSEKSVAVNEEQAAPDKTQITLSFLRSSNSSSSNLKPWTEVWFS